MNLDLFGRDAINRRQMLRTAGGGFGMLALAGMLHDEARAAPAIPLGVPASPLAIKPPHFAPKAKRVIHLFMSGGPSQIDMFDPKPMLAKYNGQPMPISLPKLQRTKPGNVLASPFKFAKHGQSGIEVSELLPNIAGVVDDLCVLRSVVVDNINHTGACLQMMTGEQAFSRPSIGSWLLYGLGSENQNLPGYIVVSLIQCNQGAPLYSSSFLPAAYQGTLINNLKEPIPNLTNPRLSPARQREQLDLLKQLNELHLQSRREENNLNARIASFELAFRMQRDAPEAFDVEQETAATRRLYGIDNKTTEIFGRQCLMARRLVERGVRCVQLYHMARMDCAGNLWDQHTGLKTDLPANCAAIDLPVAGLLKDLKARGLLDETLVVWGGEFGRTPTGEQQPGKHVGREHHPFGFTMWMAGGGVKPGMVYGATDDFGWYAVENKVHLHDLHATILHLMGIDHKKLTYRYSGRDYRLTDVSGNVVHDIIA